MLSGVIIFGLLCIVAFIYSIFSFKSIKEINRRIFTVLLCTLLIMAISAVQAFLREGIAAPLSFLSNDKIYEVVVQIFEDSGHLILLRTPASELLQVKPGKPRLYRIKSPVPEGTRYIKLAQDRKSLIPYEPKDIK